MRDWSHRPASQDNQFPATSDGVQELQDLTRDNPASDWVLRQADSQSLTSPSRIDTWKRLVRSIPSALSSPANLVPLAEPVFGSSCIAIWTAPLTHFGEIVSGVTPSRIEASLRVGSGRL